MAATTAKTRDLNRTTPPDLVIGLLPALLDRRLLTGLDHSPIPGALCAVTTSYRRLWFSGWQAALTMKKQGTMVAEVIHAAH
jgi:hypothetical protein